VRTTVVVAASFAVTLVAAFAPRVARACAVCATADTTLTPQGQEQPFAGRLHASVDVRAGGVEAGGIQVDDRRAELAFAYAPSETLLLTLGVPALSRSIVSPDGATADRTSLGDIELGLHVVRTRHFDGGLTQRFGVFVGLKLPTAPREADATGAVLSSVLQPGCGSLVPAGGFDYALRSAVWSAYGSLSLWLPFAVRAGPHAGESLRASVRAQWQPTRTIALRAGPSARLDAPGELASGTGDPNSGGVVLYAAGAIVVTPLTDLTIEVGGLYPALQALNGEHREGAIAAVTLGWDF
jgi:hypothetical protein